MTVPAKRRAMSDAAVTIAHLDEPLQADSKKQSPISASSPGRASQADSPGCPQIPPPRGLETSRSPTSLPQPGMSGKLGFAHSVNPHISDIGRQLATKYALNFESGRLRAPSQDLELLCSRSHDLAE